MAADPNTSDFYSRLPSFDDPAQMVFAANYVTVPSDWWVVLTDVQGSTKAIQAGRYKEVNTVGAAGIISVQNALGDREFPYIFGGDGASLLIHEMDLEVVKSALAYTRAVAKMQFDLELRIAVVPVREVQSQGKDIRIAKFELSPDNHIALFQGGGLSLAEKLMKTQGSSYILPEGQLAIGEHTGLECRWNPVPTRRDKILALIVQTRDDVAESAGVYSKILSEILKDGSQSARPITLDNLPIAWPPINLNVELKIKFANRFKRFAAKVQALAFTALAVVILRFKKKDVSTEPGRYLNQLILNTDFLKFDDCLRMIIDVSEDQLKGILEILEVHFNKNEIFYGVHTAPHALMTCFVQNPKRHIHFVDADLGGYAIAAQMLKQQIKQQKSDPQKP